MEGPKTKVNMIKWLGGKNPHNQEAVRGTAAKEVPFWRRTGT